MTRIYLDDEPLAEVKAMSVEPDDVIVIECHWPTSSKMADWIRARVEAVFPGHRILILDDSVKIGATRPVGSMCDRRDFGGQLVGAACEDCGHVNLVHGKKDGCAVCRLPLAAGGIINRPGPAIVGE